MPTVFISHSSQDKSFVDRLAADLEVAGLDVWYDKWEIKVSDSIVQKINEGLSESDYLVVVLSPNSVESAWVQQELSSALMSSLSERGIIVLPVLYQDCEVPYLLRDRRYADFRSDYQAGLQSLLYVLRQERATVAPPTVGYKRPCQIAHMRQEELRRLLNQRLDLQEVKTICFDLEIDYDNLTGERKNEKIMELILYLAHRGSVSELVNWVIENRPDLC